MSINSDIGKTRTALQSSTAKLNNLENEIKLRGNYTPNAAKIIGELNDLHERAKEALRDVERHL